jgi:hypothetical protein
MPRRPAPHASGVVVEMAGLLDFMKYDKDAPGADVDEQTALELRRLANLFLVSGITLALFVLRALGEALSVTFIPQGVYVAWGVVLLTGWAATEVYGVYVTFIARRWGWFVLCLLPVTCVPASVAYAWIRRQEIERAVLGDRRAPASRQRRGGRKKR